MRRAEGSIKEIVPGKHYRVRITGGINPETGRPRRPSKVVRGTRRQAELVLATMLLEEGKTPDIRLTLSEYIDLHFLPHRKTELKQTSYEGYVRRIDNHIRPTLGDVFLDEISAPLIRRTLDGFALPSVRREVRKMLRMILQDAVYNDLLEANPVLNVKPPKVPTYRPEVLTPDEIATYLDHFQGTRIEPVFLVALGCGLRRGEIVALNVEDIDPDTGAIRVDDEYVPVQGGSHHDTPKSDAGTRTVHMPRALLDRLLPLLPESGPICRALDGHRLRPESVTHLYEKTLKTLPDGVRRVSLKNLRHSSLTLAYEATGDLLAAKERAGHSNIAITSRYYVRPTGQRDMQAASAMDDALI